VYVARTLQAEVEAGRLAEWGRRVELVRQMVAGLHYLHWGTRHLPSAGSGILHRDIKPSNVLIDDRGVAKLADFGQSRKMERTITHSNALGTVGWQAPEIAAGERNWSHATDVFSLGLVVFYAMSGGEHPFGGPDVRVRRLLQYEYGAPGAADALVGTLERGVRSGEAVHLLLGMLAR
jgi:serine/threonine protein kinase